MFRNMKNLVSLSLFCALVLATTGLPAEDTWTRKADMPTARHHLSAVVVDGKIYAIGGHVASGSGGGFSTVEEYDPTTDTWTRKAPMPTARGGLAVVAVEGKIYAIGGMTRPNSSFATVEEYDPVTDTWARRADMPTPRFALSAESVNGKIYAIGGEPWWPATTSAVEEYDPVADTWTQKAAMPTARSQFVTGVVHDKIYAIGGCAEYPDVTAIVEEYDPLTDTWTARADMPTARGALAACATHGRIFAIGGVQQDIDGPPVPLVEVYNPRDNTWSSAPDMLVARSFLAAGVVNRKIYAIGGTTGAYPWPAAATVEEYIPGIPLPPPDFNVDYIIDIDDLLILIQSWGQNDLMCDIAPPPLGDGIVDIQDLEVLMSQWGQELLDPSLVGHWAMDETEGLIAHDSAGQNDGVLQGDPVWRPSEGMVGGALRFDGIDDYVTTEYTADGARFGFVLSPPDGPFSVFAWVKGGTAGQVVLSQIGGANWLMASTSGGALATELKSTRGGPLSSETIITDGDWHRIGFIREGSRRMLYVDDILVAEDAQSALAACYGGLNIGTGTNMASGAFWSGLIDDVRIYDRAVKP